ncbi:MAG: HesA/MoeB/ThiF family protein [Thermosphaera sp.]
MEAGRMSLTDEEIERYSRQIPIIGLEGQLKLKRASVLVAGAGGLGSSILYYLVAGGIGRIVVIDEGVVELSNLQRQILYTVDDIGKPKVLVASQRLKKLNPNVEVIPVHARIDENVAEKYVKEVDVVVDALDNWDTRFILDKACWRHGKPFIHGGVGEFYGQVTTLIPGVTPCLRCLFQGIAGKNTKPVIVLPHIPGIVGLLEVNEVFKILLGVGEPMINKIALFNGKTNSLEVVEVKKFDCKLCSE